MYIAQNSRKSENSPRLVLCCCMVQAESVTETSWICWTGQRGDPEHSSGKWDNVLLTTLHLVLPPCPSSENWEKPFGAWVGRGAEGSFPYVCFALTWEIPGFVLTRLILAYSVAQILDAAFFLCLWSIFEEATYETVEVLCVCSVYEINNTCLYCLYFHRN